jgi:hypothetical protein
LGPADGEDEMMTMMMPDTINEAHVYFLIRLKPSMIAIKTKKKTTTDFP